MIGIRICGIFLGFFMIIIILRNYKKNQDLLSPGVIFLFLEFIRYVPGLLVLDRESSIIFTFDDTVKLVVMEAIYIIFALVGMHIAKRVKLKKRNINYDIPLSNILICFFIGAMAKFLAIEQLGGIKFVLANPQLAYQMQAHGFGIYTQFYKFMQLAILAICEKAILNKGNKKYIIISGCMIIFYIMSFLIYTSRTPAFIMLLIILFIINFKVKTITMEKLFDIRILIIIVFIFSASFYATKSRSDSVGTMSNTAFVDMIKNFSNDGRDMFVYNYFNTHNKLLGKGYLNILPSLIPGVKDKPSTDDGLYLVNLIRGYEVDVNANYNTYPSKTGSVPFSTQGYMYANFRNNSGLL